MTTDPDPISESDLRRMLMDPGVPDERIAPYLMESVREGGSFSPVVIPNPALVARGAEEGAVLLSSVNRIARWRRAIAYRRKIDGWTGPRLVSEGDSWFQYPLLLRDVIDQLGDRYAIRSLGAAGDLMSDIDAQDELIAAIAAERPDGVLLSGGGNDLLGDGRLVRALRPFDPSFSVEDYVTEEFERTLREVVALYRRLLARIVRGFPGLPVFCHGYDHAVPARGRWLGRPLEDLGIRDPALQRALVGHLVDRFYGALDALVREPALDGAVEVVDCRGVVEADWHDELHPTSEGYRRVADLFHARIGRRISAEAPRESLALAPRPRPTDELGTAAERMADRLSEEALMAEIGRRSLLLSADPEAPPRSATAVPEAALEGLGETFSRLGRRIVARLNRELHALLCGDAEADAADRQTLGEAFGIGRAAVSATLVRVLIGSFGLAPAVATLVAAVMIKRVLEPTIEETCRVWGESLDRPD